MSCKSCQSANQRMFESEVNIYFPGLKHVTKRPVLAFPDLVICIDCGFIEGRITEQELQQLTTDVS